MSLNKYQQKAADYLGWLYLRTGLKQEDNPNLFEEARDGLAIAFRLIEENAVEQSKPTAKELTALLEKTGKD